MALLAEEIVEEWLNRQGYFTIRGVKLGVHEMDLLAIGVGEKNKVWRHIEVQASSRPISYVTPLPKEVQKATGRGPAHAGRRSEADLRRGIGEWIEKKFDLAEKQRLKRKLGGQRWTKELVVHRVKYEEELALIVEAGVVVHRLEEVVKELQDGGLVLQGAAGAHLIELVGMLGKRP